MSRGLVFEQTLTPGVVVARLGERTARVEFHVCNGRAVIGFDEPHPDEEVERALLRINDFALARRLRAAVPL